MANSKVQVLKSDLLYPELSYELIGSAFDVFNELGFGHPEKAYQKAYAIALTGKKIKFTEQAYFPVKFRDQIVSKSFFDFFIEEKIVVELKRDNRFSKQHIDRVLEYLKVSNTKLAILINFAKEGVVYKRLINLS